MESEAARRHTPSRGLLKGKKDMGKGKGERSSSQWQIFVLIVLSAIGLFLYVIYHDNMVQTIHPTGFSKYSLLFSPTPPPGIATVHNNLRKEDVLTQESKPTEIKLSKPIINNGADSSQQDTGEDFKKKKVDPPKTKEKPTKPSTKKKNGKPRDPYLELDERDADWGLRNEWKYIEVIKRPDKVDLKKDRRVIFPNITFPKPSLPTMLSILPPTLNSKGDKIPHGLLKANALLKQHPLYLSPSLRGDSSDYSLENVLYNLQTHPKCTNIPIFLTMATVGDDLYWQLIENFIYSMIKFDYVDCSLLICVSDKQCMQKCSDSLFPCYNYQENRGNMNQAALPSVMEQIAKVKLFYIPKALGKGVNVFLLDLDVGFLNHPKYMIQVFQETPIVDILVQEDYIFIMNRTKAGWKQWFTEQLPNIGLFLCRGNNRTMKVFDIAWEKYLKMKDPYEKSLPGKDQNHVLDAMRIGRGTFGLKYAYFTNQTTPLLDKLILKRGLHLELGGQLMEQEQFESQSIAIHATCYEKSTKVMGLKASNAFWNPKYYNVYERTLTKPLLFLNEQQLLDEIRSLIWLAMSSKRSLIVPNILGPTKYSRAPTGMRSEAAMEIEDLANGLTPQQRNQKKDHYRSFAHLLAKLDLQTEASPFLADKTELAQHAEFLRRINDTADITNFETPLPNYWPGFRVVYLKRSHGQNTLAIKLLEPSYYWRIGRDYEKDVPKAKVVYFDASNKNQEELLNLRDKLASPDSDARIVLHPTVNLEETLIIRQKAGGVLRDKKEFTAEDLEKEVQDWADDSIGFHRYSYEVMKESYQRLPSIKTIRHHEVPHLEDILQDMRLCKFIFDAPLGNRTCFQVCK